VSVSPFDSALYGGLFGDDAIAPLFSDTAEIGAMTQVLAALAKAQGAAGVIPRASARFLHRAAPRTRIDPAALAPATARNGVTVPGLVAAMRAAMAAPEHAQYLHWGATSQDIQDTGLVLRLRRALDAIDARLASVLGHLADLADAHAETPHAARTYGQIAVPSSFGAMVAAWGAPLLSARQALPALRARALTVSLAGAAGTGTMLGPDPAAIRADVARILDLCDPGASWHAERGRIRALAAWMAELSVTGGKIGEDLLRLGRSEVAEVGLGDAGGSSTMPQKRNPVAASALVALSRFAAAQALVVTGAHHGEARDGAAWFGEWLALPQLVAACAQSLLLLDRTLPDLRIDADAMLRRLDDPPGLIHAETLGFALSARMPRQDAQAAVADLILRAQATGASLPDLLRAAHPDLAMPDLRPAARLGQAPVEARAFADAARAALDGA